ncbi:hypothetical protein [Kitasatospora kifunensis]|uniref:Ricin B lectin domain-containing protein n=1 Tax=Kitasatospora kifunensis TaxID=58351 RepID=A0A7W7W0S1_KITKI|nr:hypothetical protein [Kitasatospora kifunensis]MBB4929009.1 hypothetical protein [Kitasatospora kifunensis]
MRKARAIQASAVALTAVSLLTFGMASSASADGTVTWRNGINRYYLTSTGRAGAGLTVSPSSQSWFDTQAPDGNWYEVDQWGYCLTNVGSGPAVTTDPCNSVYGYQEWKEINTGNGWKLQNASTGNFLDWTGASLNLGTVYAHTGDANNMNERWY